MNELQQIFSDTQNNYAFTVAYGSNTIQVPRTSLEITGSNVKAEILSGFIAMSERDAAVYGNDFSQQMKWENAYKIILLKSLLGQNITTDTAERTELLVQQMLESQNIEVEPESAIPVYGCLLFSYDGQVHATTYLMDRWYYSEESKEIRLGVMRGISGLVNLEEALDFVSYFTPVSPLGSEVRSFELHKLAETNPYRASALFGNTYEANTRVTGFDIDHEVPWEEEQQQVKNTYLFLKEAVPSLEVAFSLRRKAHR